MNALARTAAVLAATAGLALGLAPAAGATTLATTGTAAPAHHHDHHWREGHGYGDGDWGGPCGGLYFYQGYWYDRCGNVMASDPDHSQPSGGDDD